METLYCTHMWRFGRLRLELDHSLHGLVESCLAAEDYGEGAWTDKTCWQSTDQGWSQIPTGCIDGCIDDYRRIEADDAAGFDAWRKDRPFAVEVTGPQPAHGACLREIYSLHPDASTAHAAAASLGGVATVADVRRGF